MDKMNWGRVFLGGLLWAAVYNILGGVTFYLFLKSDFTAAMEALGRPFQESEFLVVLLPVTLLVGIFTLWLYAAIRPRYGPGPKTAVYAGLTAWLIGNLLPTILWAQVLRLPTRVVIGSVAAGLVSFVVAAVVGAWPYKE